jgi:hypothetical protein
MASSLVLGPISRLRIWGTTSSQQLREAEIEAFVLEEKTTPSGSHIAPSDFLAPHQLKEFPLFHSS